LVMKSRIVRKPWASPASRFKSRVLVDNKTVVILWTKRKVDVRPYPWRGLVCVAQAHWIDWNTNKTKYALTCSLQK
jgi:hypothetical protein